MAQGFAAARDTKPLHVRATMTDDPFVTHRSLRFTVAHLVRTLTREALTRLARRAVEGAPVVIRR